MNFILINNLFYFIKFYEYTFITITISTKIELKAKVFFTKSLLNYLETKNLN